MSNHQMSRLLGRQKIRIKLQVQLSGTWRFQESAAKNIVESAWWRKLQRFNRFAQLSHWLCFLNLLRLVRLECFARALTSRLQKDVLQGLSQSRTGHAKQWCSKACVWKLDSLGKYWRAHTKASFPMSRFNFPRSTESACTPRLPTDHTAKQTESQQVATLPSCCMRCRRSKASSHWLTRKQASEWLQIFNNVEACKACHVVFYLLFRSWFAFFYCKTTENIWVMRI